jgi:hypothetical protein
MSTAMISAALSTCSVTAQRSPIAFRQMWISWAAYSPAAFYPTSIHYFLYQQALTIYSIVIVTPPIFLFLFIDKNESGRDVLSLLIVPHVDKFRAGLSNHLPLRS